MEIVQSTRISSALAVYKAFANYRPAQTIFKTLVSDGIYKELIDVQISNPSNQISKYVTRISGTYGYQSALVERLICEILIGLGKCTYKDIELRSIIRNNPSSLSEKLNNQEEPIDASNATALPDHQFPYRLPGTDVFQEEYVYIPDDDDLMRIKERIMWLLGGYGIVPFSIESYPGPRYSMFELMVDSKHLSKLIRNEKDILDALGNKGCRIINPLPNKFAIGLEIPNQNVNEIIPPYYLFKSKQYTDTDAILPLALGIDSRNECIVKDLYEINDLLLCG